MRTIAFYSYKGGVGRSLLVANVAKYLSIIGKSVFALDFDLEAPGLHYKFELEPTAKKRDPGAGLVDLLTEFLKSARLPVSLADFGCEIETPKTSGKIRLMWPGAAPHGDYWRKLASLDWHDLFYGPKAVGALFFSELQQRIQREFKPDFLLIDARTGITEMGGVATTILPEMVVALGLPTREHLEGLRAVMHGIRKSPRGRGVRPIEIIPVVSRLANDPATLEAEGLKRVLTFLNEPVGTSGETLDLSEVAVLHSEPSLTSGERLLVGGTNSPQDLPLLRDYLRLFSRIIPPEEIRPHVGALIVQATARILDDPEGAQANLEELTTYCADPDAYRALLKLYRLRRAPFDKILGTAAMMCELSSVSTSEPILFDVVKAAFSDPRTAEVHRRYAPFGESVWSAAGGRDSKIAIGLSTAYLPEDVDAAINVLRAHTEAVDPPGLDVVIRLIELLRAQRRTADGISMIERFKGVHGGAAALHAAWTRLVVDAKEPASARSLLLDKTFRLDLVASEDPVAAYRIRQLAGNDRPLELLNEITDQTIVEGSLGKLRELAEVYAEQGRLRDFETKIKHSRLPPNLTDDLLETVARQWRQRGLFR